ncbi:Homocysteine-binding domain [Phytophthora cactorum]|nr:Homocysteine-binding domain [Phytophthora cactorum]
MTTTIRKTVTLLDGGTGEELFARGLPDDRRIWSATALVHEQHHKLLREVHTSFLHANADYITCNNYGVTPGVGFSDDEIDNPHDETEAKDLRVATSVTGELQTDKVPGHKEGVRLYAMIARTLKPFVDCYLAETLSSIQEAKMALLGVQQARSGESDGAVGVMVSFTLNSHGRLRGGEKVCDVAEELMSFSADMSGAELQAILFNCSQPEAICKALGELHNDDNIHASLRSRGVRLGAYANRLTVIPDDWALAESSEPQAMRTDLAEERYRDFVSQWVELGAEIVGGCCGIGPEYIASIHGMLQQQGRR